MRSTLVLTAAIVLFGCAEAAPPPAAPAPPAANGTPAAAAPIRFIEDDLPAATAKAKAEGKALFVDAWAPWCHTCLSMKNFVFTDPALRPLADRVVFASVDTDRPDAAAFLEKHAVKAWPTFFVIDPATDKVVGYWAGSGSLREMRGFIDESLALMRGGAADPASRAFAEARAEHAAGNLEKAAATYERALAAAPAGWPSRSAALLGWIEALAGAKAWPACVRVGTTHLSELQGSSAPSDFSSYLLTCASKLPAGPEQTAARTAAVARLRDFTAHPPPDASVDDRQDALDILSGALADLGDAAGARRVQEDRLALLEQAAKAARSPEVAHTFDYARANTYLALGRADEAVRMLEQRERELPDSYEPPARLAGVLFKAGRLQEAKAAAERAIARSYGPRRLRYVQLAADIHMKLGDTAGALAMLREEVKGWESLPPGQASPERLAEARRRLAEAEKAAPR
ncbi:MAG: thioredoxin family protein [Minicystis sp.]